MFFDRFGGGGRQAKRVNSVGREQQPKHLIRKSGRAPSFEALEDRSLLSINPITTFPPGTGVATHLGVFAPHETHVNENTGVAVVALDANNFPASSFVGPVHFSSTDAAAVLPQDFIFQASDHGYHFFQVKFETPGTDSLNITQVLDPTSTVSPVAGSVTVQVDAPQVATHFALFIQPNVQSGAPARGYALALDAQNHPVNSYSGVVNITTTDGAAAPIGPVTFRHGFAFFSITFNTPGPQTVTATDSVDASITAQAKVNVAVPAVTTHFGLLLLPNVQAGQQVTVWAVALDANNRPAMNYNGPVTITNTDAAGTTPATVNFEHGQAHFQVTFASVGPQTITLTDAANLTGAANTNVAPAAVATRFYVYLPQTLPVGVTITGYLIALDAQNHPAFNYTGSAALGSTGQGVTLPPSVSFKNGRASFQVSFASVGTYTLTATDAVTSTLTGAATVNVADAPHHDHPPTTGP